MSNENRIADDSRGLSEMLAVFSQIARNTSEAEERAVTTEEVRTVFSQIARNASAAEEPAVTTEEVRAVFSQIARDASKAKEPAVTTESEAERRTDRTLPLRADTQP